MNYVDKKITCPELKEDGWYYFMGFRFHGSHYVNSNYFDEIWDLERF